RSILPPDTLVRMTQSEATGDPWGECSIEQLTGALARLIQRGWMCVLQEEDGRHEAERRAGASIPEIFDFYRAGCVDFTPAGYQVHRDWIGRHGPDHLAQTDKGFNQDREACRFDVYASRQDTCLEVMN